MIWIICYGVSSCFILISQVNQKTYKSYAFGVSLCKKNVTEMTEMAPLKSTTA